MEWRPGRRVGKDVSEAGVVGFFFKENEKNRKNKLSHC